MLYCLHRSIAQDEEYEIIHILNRINNGGLTRFSKEFELNLAY